MGKPEPPPKTHKGRGRPDFQPTAEQKRLVRKLAGHGLTLDEIATFIINPSTHDFIGATTLTKHFKTELEIGRVRMKAKVHESIYKKALGNSQASVTAAIFILKARYGWRTEDRVVHEVSEGTGVLIVPALANPNEWLKQQREREAGKQEPGE